MVVVLDPPFLREMSLTRSLALLLPAADGSRLLLSCNRFLREVADRCLLEVLEQRGFPSTWSWQRVHLAETAILFDPLLDPNLWQRGPNRKAECNRLEVSPESWLWLSGGTDWQLFQGAFRDLPESDAKPPWLSFEVFVGTPEFAGAFVALAPGTHNWGLETPTVIFAYNGDERAAFRRSFTVSDGSSFSETVATVLSDVEPRRAYAVAMHLDWSSGTFSVYVDGVQRIADRPFNAENVINTVALYNWRRQAQHALANLCLGPHPPPLAPLSGRECPRHLPWHLPSLTACGGFTALAVLVAVAAMVLPKSLELLLGQY